MKRMRPTRRTALIAVAALLAILLVAGQLLIPGLAERKVEQRLTEHGGSAEVELQATPALRLLFGHGDEIRIRGSDLGFDLTAAHQDPLERLDGFDRVDVRFAGVSAGPFDVSRFALTRDGSGPYELRMRSSFTPAGLAGLGANQLSGGSMLGFLLGSATGAAVGRVPGGARPIPLNLDVRVESDSGRVRVTGGQATVAGYPTGPLAQLITAAIVVRI